MIDTIVTDTSQLSAEVLQLMGYLQGNLPWILVLVASAAVMQLVTMVVLLTGRRRGRGHHYGHDRRPGAPAGGEGKPDGRGQGGAPRRADGGRDGGQRKPGGDNRGGGGQRQGGGGQQGGGRPQQQERGGGGRPSQPSIDPMEMSLRDINQRLKNAEREQDSARRNLRDVGDGSDGEGRGRGDGRQQRGGRDNRDGRDGRDGRGGNRDDRGPRRDSNRGDNRGGGRPERQERGDNARPPQEHGRFRQNEQAADAPEIVPNDIGASEDQLQHGRRFTAKRRTLPDDSGAAEEAGQQQYQPAPESAPGGGSDPFGGQERQSGPEDIQFGR